MKPPNSRAASPYEAALVIVVAFFLFLFIGGASLLLWGEGPTLVVGEVVILLVPLIFLMAKHIDVKSYVRADPKPKYLLLGLALGAVLLGLNIAISSLLTYLFGTSAAVEESNTLLYDLSGNPEGFALVAASLVLAGICEEFAFRGFLQNSITRRLAHRRYAHVPAILIAALVFGLFHFDPQGIYILAAFISGTALGYIYHRLNYVASATAHASMNLMVLALLLLGI